MPVIRGIVHDKNGQPVSEASVYIASSPSSHEDIATLTDSSGRFAITARLAGIYRIGVRASHGSKREIEVQVPEKDEVNVAIGLDS